MATGSSEGTRANRPLKKDRFKIAGGTSLVITKETRGYRRNIRGDNFFELYLKFEEPPYGLYLKKHDKARGILSPGFESPYEFEDYPDGYLNSPCPEREIWPFLWLVAY